MKVEKDYPKGVIKHISEIVNLMNEAKTEGVEARLHWVGQSGAREDFIIDKETELTRFGQFLKVRVDYGEPGKTYVSERSLMDMNVIPNTYNDHFVFTNEKLAAEYAMFVAYDPAHIKAVQEHHERCDRLFRNLW